MMMPLSSHLLNSAPRELVGRVTSLQGALQSLFGTLAIATYATLLQLRTPVHVAQVVASGQASAAALADAAASAFGDVFSAALVLAVIGFVLALTLRRPARPAQPSPAAQREAEAPPEPVLV